jgi:hypothetical protein
MSDAPASSTGRKTDDPVAPAVSPLLLVGSPGFVAPLALLGGSVGGALGGEGPVEGPAEAVSLPLDGSGGEI